MEGVSTKIEAVLSAYARPTFLAITNPDEDNDIQIVISCLAFRTMNVNERVSYLFGLLKKHIPEVLENRLIIFQAYSSEEMDEVFEKLFLPEYNAWMAEDE
jgi:hypothetical protein